mmetsp:Transcript_65000/g.210548  ORF Transcript_65000/g.210548 Transcript_65000/m.210548 type:complete len:504 (-) Transcript_65000:212-1723(-)
MEDSRLFGDKRSAWDLIHVDDDIPQYSSTESKSTWSPIGVSSSTLPPMMHGLGGLPQLQPGSSLANRSLARTHCSSITSSRGSSSASATEGRGRGLGSVRSNSSAGQRLPKPSKVIERDWFSSTSSRGSCLSSSLADDFDLVAREEGVPASSQASPPPPRAPFAKMPSGVGRAWQEAAADTHNLGNDTLDDDFLLKKGKASLNAMGSHADEARFSDPFAGIVSNPFTGPDDPDILSCLRNERATSGRHLPPMEQVAPARRLRREHRAPRPNLQVGTEAASSSVDEACGPPLEKKDEVEWVVKPHVDRPANRRPARTKTVATRPAIAGAESPEDRMASGGSDNAAASTSGDGACGPELEKEDEDEWFAKPPPPAPQEPKGPRPAKRRPAQLTAASCLAIPGEETSEEPMASGGCGSASMRMSLGTSSPTEDAISSQIIPPRPALSTSRHSVLPRPSGAEELKTFEATPCHAKTAGISPAIPGQKTPEEQMDSVAHASASMKISL